MPHHSTSRCRVWQVLASVMCLPSPSMKRSSPSAWWFLAVSYLSYIHCHSDVPPLYYQSHGVQNVLYNASIFLSVSFFYQCFCFRCVLFYFIHEIYYTLGCAFRFLVVAIANLISAIILGPCFDWLRFTATSAKIHGRKKMKVKFVSRSPPNHTLCLLCYERCTVFIKPQ